MYLRIFRSNLCFTSLSKNKTFIKSPRVTCKISDDVKGWFVDFVTCPTRNRKIGWTCNQLQTLANVNFCNTCDNNDVFNWKQNRSVFFVQKTLKKTYWQCINIVKYCHLLSIMLSIVFHKWFFFICYLVLEFNYLWNQCSSKFYQLCSVVSHFSSIT
jgi:hypothetical protein